MTVIKRPARLQPGKQSEDLPYGQRGIRRLPACIRCAPASSQSSSIYNSRCSINPATAGCSLQKPTGLFAYRSRGLETFVFLLPANLANSAILPTAKSLRSLCKISSSKSQKTPAGLCPSHPHRGRMIAFATAVQSEPSALRGPRVNIIQGFIV